MERNSHISFDFPLTVLIGKNGSGKSSVLQALYGCPFRYSLRDYWFSTAIDPISEDSTRSENKHRIIYTYFDKVAKKRVECVKARAGMGKAARKGADYWEAVKPTQYDKTDSDTRIPPIKNKVLYHDFRHHLSAFEVTFHVNGCPSNLRRHFDSKQDYIRKKAIDLKSAIKGNNTSSQKNSKINKISKIDSSVLNNLSYILGKEYLEGQIIEHQLYSPYSQECHSTVLLKSSNASYSEAGAGSGETSIAILFNRLSNVPNGTLVLLDEPEISLHPGAQKRLIQTLLNLCVDKKLQIVISTHAPEFVRELPNTSIKLFRMADSGRFEVLEDIDSRTAFVEAEVPLSKKTIIRVEDEIAKSLLEKVIKKMGTPYDSAVGVMYTKGGAPIMWKQSYAEASSNLEKRIFFVFDGDQKNSVNANRPHELSKLKDFVQTKTHDNKIEYILNSNSTDDEKISYLNKYLNFYDTHIRFLPGKVPEDIFWDAHQMEKILSTLGKTDTKEIFKKLELSEPMIGKDKIAYIVKNLFEGDVNKYLTLSDSLMEYWNSQNEPKYLKTLNQLVLACYNSSPSFLSS